MYEFNIHICTWIQFVQYSYVSLFDFICSTVLCTRTIQIRYFFLSTKPCQPTWNSKLGIINFFFLWKKSLFVEISSTTLILVFLNRSSLYCTKHKDLSIDLWYLFFCLVAGESEFSVENKHRIIFTNRILFMNKMNCLVRILVKERTNSHNLIVVNSVSV